VRIRRHHTSTLFPYTTLFRSEHFTDAIRNDKPYSEVQRGVEASLVTAMGRMSAHTGQVITRDQMLNCQHAFAPDADKLTMESPADRKSTRLNSSHRTTSYAVF